MITVVVLAFNEESFLEQTIATIVDAANQVGGITLDIIIVNDGSIDRTSEIIHKLEQKYSFVRSIHLAHNSGPGVCAKKAIAVARFPKIISVPGDNDLSKDLLVQLFLNKDKADLVMAYYLNMHERGFFRSWLSRSYTGIYRAIFNIPIHYINSPCLYPTEKLRKVHIRSDRFGYSAEMTVKMLRSGCSFTQVPGLRRTDDTESSAISWKNLNEILGVLINLAAEIHIFNRKKFSNKPVEVV